MEFSELVKSRYSCRKYSKKRVDKDLIYEIIKESLNAPSAKNTQPWEFYVAYSAEDCAKICNCLQDKGRNAFLNGTTAFIAVFENVPNVINCEKYGNDRFVKYDVGQSVAYLTLCAKNKGVDSCIIGWVNEEKLRKATGVDKQCSIVIALGYAEESTAVPQKRRAALEEKIINYEEEKI